MQQECSASLVLAETLKNVGNYITLLAHSSMALRRGKPGRAFPLTTSQNVPPNLEKDDAHRREGDSD
jgi:hypothetical protein